MKKIIATDAAPRALGPYSQGVLAGDFLFVSGQLGIDPATGAIRGTTASQQAEQAMRNIGAILEKAGYGFDQVVKTTIFLQDMGDFPAVNEVYGGFFTGAYPARATVQVGRLPLGALVEIEAVACKG